MRTIGAVLARVIAVVLLIGACQALGLWIASGRAAGLGVGAVYALSRCPPGV